MKNIVYPKIVIFKNPHLCSLSMVQMNLTVPNQQQGPALSSLRFAQGQALSAAKDLSAYRDRPFASLRVTRCDCSNCQVLFFKLNLALAEEQARGDLLAHVYSEHTHRGSDSGSAAVVPPAGASLPGRGESGHSPRPVSAG